MNFQLFKFYVTYYINKIEPEERRPRELVFDHSPSYQEVQEEISKIYEKKYYYLNGKEGDKDPECKYLNMIKLISYPQIL